MEIKLLSLHKKRAEEASRPGEVTETAEELVRMAEEQAEAALRKAQEQIRKEKEQAKAELEKWKLQEQETLKAELEKVKEQGFKQGYEHGLQQAHQDYSEKVQLAQQVLESAYEEKKGIIKESEPFVIELTTQMALKVIKKELEMNPEVLTHMIKQSLLYSNERTSISICVSPEDFHFVQNQRNQLLESLEGQVEVKILPEHSIEQGGCVIRTSYGSIDARLDVQLKEMKQALLKTLQDDGYEENT